MWYDSHWKQFRKLPTIQRETVLIICFCPVFYLFHLHSDSDVGMEYLEKLGNGGCWSVEIIWLS